MFKLYTEISPIVWTIHKFRLFECPFSPDAKHADQLMEFEHQEAQNMPLQN